MGISKRHYKKLRTMTDAQIQAEIDGYNFCIVRENNVATRSSLCEHRKRAEAELARRTQPQG